MCRFRSLHRIHPALLAVLALANTAQTPAQTPASVSGLVVGSAGRPIAAATISSGAGSQHDSAITGADGRFQLANSTTVLHIQADGYQPLTLLVSPPAGDLRIQLSSIQLSPLTGAILAPPCAPLPPKDRTVLRLGAPGGLQFTVPRKGWNLRDLGQGGIHEYVLTPRHSRAHLTLWFGANLVRLIPEDHYFLESSSFAQRAIVIAGSTNAGPPRSIGIDSSGVFPGGALWRHLATPLSGAAYDRVAPPEAALFDAIIATLCAAPGA